MHTLPRVVFFYYPFEDFQIPAVFKQLVQRKPSQFYKMALPLVLILGAVHFLWCRAGAGGFWRSAICTELYDPPSLLVLVT